MFFFWRGGGGPNTSSQHVWKPTKWAMLHWNGSNDEDLCKIQDSLKNSVKAPVTIYINQVVGGFHAQTKQTESLLDFRDTVLKIESTTYTYQSHPLCATTLSSNTPRHFPQPTLKPRLTFGRNADQSLTVAGEACRSILCKSQTSWKLC